VDETQRVMDSQQSFTDNYYEYTIKMTYVVSIRRDIQSV
jgi:hypothetical protein